MFSREELRELEDIAYMIKRLKSKYEEPHPINTDHEFSEEIRKLGNSLINWADDKETRAKL